MRIVYFTHSIESCWNHGKVHFVRGLLSELAERGHCVTACEPVSGWSRTNLVAEHGDRSIREFSSEFPAIHVRHYTEVCDAAELVGDAELVIVHEWTPPRLIQSIGRLRRHSGRFILLFHDTHHRAVSSPDFFDTLELDDFDGILAFGQSLADIYARRGWGRRAYSFHEAADTSRFRPLATREGRQGIVWIGNWGDGERGDEIRSFLLRPARDTGLSLKIFGVRYPDSALNELRKSGAVYGGWLANLDAPSVYARHAMTVHIPRRHYASALKGIPTIRVFEALACGIPLISAPWEDCEGLFSAGDDYLVADDEMDMRAQMRALANDVALRKSVAYCGLRRIRAHHTCAHRADQLLAITHELRGVNTAEATS